MTSPLYPVNANRFIGGGRSSSPIVIGGGQNGPVVVDPDRIRDRDGDRRRGGRGGDRRDRRDGDDGGGWNFGYWGGPFYPYGPYSAADRVDYSVNTPSPQSNSPYQINLNDGIHLSPLDSGYPGPLPAVGGWVNPYPPQPTTIPAPGLPGGVALAPTAPDVDLVVGVQRELRRLGYYQGVVNGVSDARTRSAIRAYEARLGLPVTGVIGTVLVRSLGLF